MVEILESQKIEANVQFGKFIERNYEDWFQPKADKPILSHEIFGELVAPRFFAITIKEIIITHSGIQILSIDFT